ncbi:MAG: iron-containing alcohol dehydrogenase [Clostridia bacterium]|nr:iron-containing alcohol dehydrogenase [Clostridia bacterium]
MAQMLIEGLGSLSRYPEFLEAFKVSRPLLVGGRRHRETIAAAAYFSGYHPNPDLSDALAGAERFNAHHCDCLISIGGGSAIDTAKAIKHHLGLNDLPHLAIPTTAGTGAETTRYAVVYVDNKKTSLDFDHLTPDAALLDGELLASLPVYHKHSCLVDALAQGIESYWAKASTDETRPIAARGIQAVMEHLEPYLAGEHLQEMLKASYLCGQSIQLTRTTAPHAMSYALAKGYDIAHGHAVGLTLPWVWRAMAAHPQMQQVLAALEKLTGGPDALESLMHRLGLEAPQVSEKDLDTLAASVNPLRMSNHPVSLTSQELRHIYAQALGLEA